jgi:thymidylate synthase (FAD)
MENPPLDTISGEVGLPFLCAILAQPPHGYVRYVDHLGSDQRIVQTARHSYAQGSKGDEADKKLLFYLYKNRHTSPFEQCSITFEIKFPIFLMRQFVRHRTYRLNEVSARYTQLPEEYYLPREWRKQNTQGNLQGSTPFTDGTDLFQQEHLTNLAKSVYDFAHRAYTTLIDAGVANEQARMVLPVAIYTKIFVNCDLHNLTHFLRLRLDAHAQAEMREVAGAMATIAHQLFPWTMEAFDRYKLVTIDSREDGQTNP